MKGFKTHFRVMREATACGTDGKTTTDRANVTCKACLKRLPPEGSTPIVPKLALGAVPPMAPTDTSAAAIDAILRKVLVMNAPEIEAALGILVATIKEHRFMVHAHAAESSPMYEDLSAAAISLIRALGVTINDNEF